MTSIQKRIEKTEGEKIVVGNNNNQGQKTKWQADIAVVPGKDGDTYTRICNIYVLLRYVVCMWTFLRKNI